MSPSPSRTPPCPPRGPILSRRAVREVDRRAVEEFGIPSIVLMENAAIGAARVALEMGGGRALIVAGTGNNGGDGLALARHLCNAGWETGVVLCGPRAKIAGDAAINLRIVERMGIPLAEPGAGGAAAAVEEWVRHRGLPALVVDAILGTGLERTVEPPLAEAIEAINALSAAGAAVLALDLPSGLDADTGRPLGTAVRATVTVTFAALKPGLVRPEAAVHTGRVVVAEIGAPRSLIERLAREEGRTG